MRYYTHPSGDYRIPLPKGWVVRPKHLFDDEDVEYDTLWPAEPDKALVCGRQRRDMGRQKAEDVLQAFSLRMSKNSPGVRSKPYAVGPASAVLVADYDGEGKVMTWHVLAAHKGHSYYMTILMPTDSANAAVPEAIAKMLAKTEFLR